MPKPPIRLTALLGPTASGKSHFAIHYARHARDREIEIVSLDSTLVYRDMNIGSAKPSLHEQNLIRHHLINLCSPEEVYSVGRFVNDFNNTINDIICRGKTPLVVGGTMMYFNALLNGLSDLPQAHPEIRNTLRAEANSYGWPYLHARLQHIDAVTANKISPQDSQRIERALELWTLTKTAPSQLKQKAASPFAFTIIALLPLSRPWLHKQIEKRLEGMWQQGLVEEVRSLKARYQLNPALPAMRSIGYRQVWEFIEGQCSLEEMRNKTLFATRQLAKRQITWLRSLPVHHAIAPEENNCIEKITKVLDSAH